MIIALLIGVLIEKIYRPRVSWVEESSVLLFFTRRKTLENE